jgi:hypothetical protein
VASRMRWRNGHLCGPGKTVWRPARADDAPARSTSRARAAA